MASGTGIGVLLVLGLVAVGYANSGRGSTTSTAEGERTQDDEPATCDGVLVVESPSGSVRVPADTDLTDATVVCLIEPGAGDEDAVAVVQQALVQCHGQTLAIDGEYGPATAGAVSSVQRQAGIAPDGEYGPTTLEAMRWPVDEADACAGAAPGAAVEQPSPGLPVTG